MPTGIKLIDFPLRIRALRIKRGRSLTSIKILEIYSPTKPIAKILKDPNIKIYKDKPTGKIGKVC